MLKDITLGQFFPGDTVVHKLDPRIKLLLTFVYIIALFMAKSLLSYILMLAVLIAFVTLSKIKPSAALKGVRPIIIVILFTVILNIFMSDGTPLVEFWGLTITREGLITAFFTALRLILLIIGTLMLTFTTSPMALTDGIEAMLNPLKKINLPVHELAMMMSIALRFIPALIEETDKIMSAQKARVASFDTGGLIKRAKAILPLIIPLFISAIRRSDELATAMESRCYHGGEGRTRMKTLKTASRDRLALLFGAIVIAAVILLNRYVPIWT